MAEVRAKKWVRSAIPGFLQIFRNNGATRQDRTGDLLITKNVSFSEITQVPVRSLEPRLSWTGMATRLPPRRSHPIPVHGAAGYLVIGRTPGDPLGLFASNTLLPAGTDGIFHGTMVVNMSGTNVTLAHEFNGNSMLNLLVFH